jgi:hypothetical protein
MSAFGLLKSNLVRWSGFWLGFVATLILVDVFFFVPITVEIQTLTEPDRTERTRSGPLEVTWLGPPDFAIGSDELWIENHLESSFNLELEPILLDPNAYQRKKPLMLAGGPVPDVIWEADPLSLKMAVQHKFVCEVPYDLIYRHMPEYFKDITREAPTSWLYSNINGQNFGIPTYNRFGGQPSRPGMWRMDWLRNVGIDKVPSTIGEYHEALYRFRHDDPDRNGLDDTYGMSGDISNWWWTSFSEIFGAFGVTPFDWQRTSEGIVWGGIRDETRYVLELLHDWYEEGLIHPDFVVDNAAPGQSIDQKFHSGKIGYVNYKGTFMDSSNTMTGSFANNFLNLRLPDILKTNSDYAESFTGCIENGLLEYMAARYVDHLLSTERYTLLDETGRLSGGNSPAFINKTIKLWIYEETVFGRFDEKKKKGKSFEYSVSEDGPTPDQGELYSVLQAAIDQRLAAVFSPEKLDLFRTGWQKILADVDSGQAVRRVLNGEWDTEARESMEPFLAALDETGTLAETALFTVVKQYYFRQLDEGSVPPIIVPGTFPEGPDGNRGARAWGKPGNIVAFGKQVAQQPEKAVAVMKMLEAMHTDRKLYWESKIGQEGLHWEWIDPVDEASSGRGFTLKPDYKDPDTGKEIDLQVLKNGKRQMLHPSLGFYNLVAGKPEFAAYEDQRKFHYEEKYMNEKWGLTNPLGKSDVVPSASLHLGDLRMRQQTYFAEIIRGSRPISEFDEFKRLWLNKGGSTLLQEAKRMDQELSEILSELNMHLEN